MPKKVYRKRKRTYRKKTVVPSMGVQSRAQTKNPDLNYKDTSVNLVASNDGTNFTLLNGLTVGAAPDSQRVGRITVVKSIHIKGYIHADTGATRQAVNVSVIYDTQSNAAAPTAALMWRPIAATYPPYAPLSLENSKRFRVIMSKDFALSGSITAGQQTGTTTVIVDMYKKVNLETLYNSVNGGTIADIVTGSLYITVRGTEAAGATDATFFYNARLRYVP